MPTTRVLIALEPGMYAEGLAFLLGKRRPRAEVSLLGPSEGVGAGVRRVRPHLIVADRLPPAAREGAFFWAKLADPTDPTDPTDPGGVEGLMTPGAEISGDGRSKGVADVRTEHVLAALDRAEELLLGPRRAPGHARQGG